MRPILYCLVIIILAVNVILGLTQVVDLSKTRVFANNLFTAPKVAGVTQVILAPQNKEIPPPQFSAASTFALDLDSGYVYFAKDPEKQLPIASTTKILTALVASEHFKDTDELIVPELAQISGSNMGLKVGEKLTFRSLLYGLLLNSGNDAAFTIAANFPGGVDGFVSRMNQEADKLKLTSTHFDNPAGFDSPSHYSSASDLAKIAQSAYESPLIARVVGTKETVVASVDQSTIHSLKNLNKLLDIPGVVGFKTGYTNLAKENLVTIMEKDNRKVLTIVLGSDDRFGESKALLDWIFANFVW